MHFFRLSALAALLLGSAAATAQVTSVDLSTYSRVGRYDLPVGAGANQLGAEASAVTYNWDRNSLFVIGDEGTGVIEVSLTGGLLGTMGLSGFNDTEGLTYVGGGQFVIAEERNRFIDRFTYVAGGSIDATATQRVDLGTNIGNIGNEGLSFDPLTGGFIVVKENGPQGIFQTLADFAAGTASNGSASTVQPTNLFNPALLGLVDLADVFALSNLPSLDGTAFASTLLVISHESAEIVHADRAGNVLGRLTIGPLATTVAQNHEGITMDRAGNIYVVNEGGSDTGGPQLWVYSPAAVPEPATALIWGAGLLVLAARRRTVRRGQA